MHMTGTDEGDDVADAIKTIKAFDPLTRRNHPLARGGRHRPADRPKCHNTSNHLAARMQSYDDEIQQRFGCII